MSNPDAEQKIEALLAELAELKQSLGRTDQMKSRFIDVAAHELRTPLTTIRGYLGILTAPGNKFWAAADPDTRSLIEGIASGVDRLQGIVQDMLDVTRIEAGTLQLRQSPVNLTQVYAKIEREFAEPIRNRQQTLTISDARQSPIIWADGERVIQILRNLVGNAIKYTPNGGKISITTHVIGDLSRQCVKITVADTGVGIASEQQEMIFENFHEVRAIEHHSSSKTGFMGGGAGLGLPIARGVAEAHGGSLMVESAGHDPHRCPGSKFHLILPVGQPPKD